MPIRQLFWQLPIFPVNGTICLSKSQRTYVGRNAKRVLHNFDGVCTLFRCYTYLACGGGTYLLLRRPPGSITAFLSTSCDTYMVLLPIGAEWQNGGMAERRNGRMVEWQNGGMAEWQNGRMAEWQNGGMAEWRNGGMAEWYNVRYEIERNQDTESTQMPSWQSPSWLVNAIRIIDYYLQY